MAYTSQHALSSIPLWVHYLFTTAHFPIAHFVFNSFWYSLVIGKFASNLYGRGKGWVFFSFWAGTSWLYHFKASPFVMSSNFPKSGKIVKIVEKCNYSFKKIQKKNWYKIFASLFLWSKATKMYWALHSSPEWSFVSRIVEALASCCSATTHKIEKIHINFEGVVWVTAVVPFLKQLYLYHTHENERK